MTEGTPEEKRSIREYFSIHHSLLFVLILYLRRVEMSIVIMDCTIDTYRLTSMEEPSDAVLSQLMKEAAEDAKRTNAKATRHFFEQMRQEAQTI